MKKVTVYGPGCPKCKMTEQVVNDVIAQIGEVSVEKVTDYQAIAQAGIMSTPAVAIDGVVKVVGRVPKPNEVKQWLKEQSDI